jgi:hypothetical protein
VKLEGLFRFLYVASLSANILGTLLVSSHELRPGTQTVLHLVPALKELTGQEERQAHISAAQYVEDSDREQCRVMWDPKGAGRLAERGDL